MGSPRPLSCSRRALGAAGLGAAGALVFALGVHLGTQGLPALSGSGRFRDVTTDRVALVAPPPALPQVIPFGARPALSDDTARALLGGPAAPGIDAVGPVAAPVAPADPAPAPAPAPLAALPVAPPPVVLPDPGAAVPGIALPEPDAALPPLPTVPQVVALVGGLLPLPIL